MARQSTGDRIPVLLTRPLAQSEGFAAALIARHGPLVRPVIAPLMVPALLAPPVPAGGFAAVIFTSVTGVAAASGLDLPRRAYCVGAQTAQAARAAGFAAVSADGDAEGLIACILADPPPGRLLHLRGEDSRGEIAERLTLAGAETVSLVTYRQAPQPLTAEALDLLAQPGSVIIPLFSPRSAVLLHAALPGAVQAPLFIAAMSAAVARAALPMAQQSVVIARHPDAEAMLEATGVLLGQLRQMRPAP